MPQTPSQEHFSAELPPQSPDQMLGGALLGLRVSPGCPGSVVSSRAFSCSVNGGHTADWVFNAPFLLVCSQLAPHPGAPGPALPEGSHAHPLRLQPAPHSLRSDHQVRAAHNPPVPGTGVVTEGQNPFPGWVLTQVVTTPSHVCFDLWFPSCSAWMLRGCSGTRRVD